MEKAKFLIPNAETREKIWRHAYAIFETAVDAPEIEGLSMQDRVNTGMNMAMTLILLVNAQSLADLEGVDSESAIREVRERMVMSVDHYMRQMKGKVFQP